MRLLKRLAGILGLSKDEDFRQQHADSSPSSSSFDSTTLPDPKGSTVPARIPAQRGPILVPCTSIQGGLQGLRWFARRLKIDEDGDVADEFLEEVIPDMQESMEVDHIAVTNIEVKYIVRPAKVRNQMISPDGKLQHYVENQGRLQWI